MKRILLAAFIASQASSAFAQSFTITTQDFVTLVTKASVGQPTNTPWAGSYWAYGGNGIATNASHSSADGVSPAQRYDGMFSAQATAWEKANHSCSQYSGETKTDCEGWWGHCNAWSAAAIKEPEPRKAISYNGKSYSVSDQKAYLTELWMSSGALFEGHTDKSQKTGDWIFNPNSPQAKKIVDNSGTNAYQAFWDVSPRQFFLIFTNYVGLMKQGVVIDRFTGNEVWNQPIVGYKILSITKESAATLNGATVYPVKISMQIFWANDGVGGEHISSAFNIHNTANINTTDYAGRTLKFKLYLSAPVNVSGVSVSSANGGAVSIVGPGVWDAMENPSAYPEMNKTHPDFIWQPTQLASGGSRNPHIVNANVRKILVASSNPGTGTQPPPQPEPGPVVPPPNPPPGTGGNSGGTTAPTGDVMSVKFLRNKFGAATLMDIKFKLQNAITRENINPTYLELLPSGNNVVLKLSAPGVTLDQIKAHFIAAGYEPLP